MSINDFLAANAGSYPYLADPLTPPDFRNVEPGRYELDEPITPINTNELLVILACYLDAMRTLAHLIHLNYTGRDFISVHAYMKERYEEHIEQFDAVAELARIHGAMMPTTVAELRQQLAVFKDDACLCAYLDNLCTLKILATNLERTASECNCIDVANAMADIVAAAGKAAWFIRITVGNEQTA